MVLFLFEVFFEPDNEIFEVLELLLMEVQPHAPDLDQLLDGLPISIDIHQNEKLWIVLMTSKEVMDVRGVPRHVSFGLLLYLFDFGWIM